MPAHTISEQRELADQFGQSGGTLLEDYVRTRTYTEKDGDGVSKLPGWKAFIEAARD